MKYVLLFGGTMEPEERANNPEMQAAYEQIDKWFDEYGRAGKIIGGHELKGPHTATTVRFKDGKPMVVDGPFIESKEVIGGYAELEVRDLDEALEIAKTWPGKTNVEVRPIVEN
jgi:hypothetical protein